MIDHAYFEAWKREVKNAQQPSRPTFRVIGRWQIGLSLSDSMYIVGTLGMPAWQLSAQLHSAVNIASEWQVLGELVALVGAPDPETCILTPIETTPWDAVHHWIWREDGVALPKPLLIKTRKALAERARQRLPARAPDRPARNDRCPCGSGRKYKVCHGGN